MKTQLLNTITGKVIILAMLIALTTITASAQRRETTKQSKEKIEKPILKSNNKQAKYTPHEGTQRRASENYSRNYNKKLEDRSRKNNNEHREYAYRITKKNQPGVHVHITPPVMINLHTPNYYHQHIRFHKIPRKAVWIELDNVNYMVYKKKFYLPTHGGFYRVKKPKYSRALPANCSLVIINGKPFYHLHGILFANTPRGYKIMTS